MGGTYDPARLGRLNFIYIEVARWPPATAKVVADSITRYSYYLNSDSIKADQLSKYNKLWLINSLSHLSDGLLRNELVLKKLIRQVF